MEERHIPDSAIILYHQALKQLDKAPNDTLKGDIYNRLGDLLLDHNLYETAYDKIEAEEAQAQVYTTSGSLVWEGRVINQRDLDLNQGIYIVKVHNASSTQSKKVVVK